MICENCVHKEVCGLEGYYDEALIICTFKTEFVPLSVIDEMRAEIRNEIDKNTEVGKDYVCPNEYAYCYEDVLKIIDEKVKEYTDESTSDVSQT